MNWHKRLTLAREAKKIKKSAFAKLVGVSAPTVTDWENGETKMIEGANLVKVCHALGITPKWLIDGKVPPEPDESIGVTKGKMGGVIEVDGDEMYMIERYRAADDDDKKLMRVVASGIGST